MPNLKWRLSNAPTIIGRWNSELAELSDGEYGVLNASDVSSRKFTDPSGQVAFVHMATWTDPDEIAETCPHHPGVCYAGNGWFSVETRAVQLEVPGVGFVPVEISVMQRDNQRIVIAFTYEMGQFRFSTDTDARLAQTQMWGQRQWPPVTKYLIQISAAEIEGAMPIVDELLSACIAWHNREDRTEKMVDAQT